MAHRPEKRGIARRLRLIHSLRFELERGRGVEQEKFRRGRKVRNDQEAPPAGGLDGRDAPRRRGLVERRTAFVATDFAATTISRPPVAMLTAPTRRSISAPTIAGCWSRVRPPTDFGSSTPSRESFGSGRASPRRGVSARRRSSAPSRRFWSVATKCARAACGAPGSLLPKRAGRPRTAKISATALRKRPVSSLRSSTPRPRRGWRRRAAPNCSIPLPPASSCSTSAADRRRSCGSAGPMAARGAGRRCPISWAGRRSHRRRHPCGALWRRRGAARDLRRHGRGGGILRR